MFELDIKMLRPRPVLRSAAAQDCEFTYLSVQILHLMGVEGPHTKQPARYIRYIYNRIILENATVRAAAVSSLALFGAGVKDLTPRIVTLLKRALYDNDDEVRLLPLDPSNSRSLAFSVATSVKPDCVQVPGHAPVSQMCALHSRT